MKKIIVLLALLIASKVFGVETFPDPVYFNSQLFVPRLAADPTSTSANAGSIWFNRATQTFKGDTGSVIVPLSGGAGGGGASTPHNLVSASHLDTGGTVSTAAVLRYVPGVNQWQPLAAGASYQLLGMNATSGDLAYRTIFGTLNQIAITHTPGGIQVFAAQDLSPASSPVFANINVSGNGVIAGSQIATQDNAMALNNKTIVTANILAPTLSNGVIQGNWGVGTGLNIVGGLSTGPLFVNGNFIADNVTAATTVFAQNANINSGAIIGGSTISGGHFTGNAATAGAFNHTPGGCLANSYPRNQDPAGNFYNCETVYSSPFTAFGASYALLSGGGLGIGTGPAQALDVIGNIQLTGDIIQAGLRGATFQSGAMNQPNGCKDGTPYVRRFTVSGGIVVATVIATCTPGQNGPGPGDE